jgi:hypothetical protein
LDFERAFPSLVDFHWTNLWADDPLNLEILAQVTTLDAFLPHSPFEILSQMPRVKVVDLSCRLYTNFELQAFELNSLTDLKLDCSFNLWTLDELKAVFSFFPNLIDLFLKLRGLTDNYDEQVSHPNKFFSVVTYAGTVNGSVMDK